ncbi:MAG TPA: hypothetical protein VH933_17525 [Aestuariivirgaceae bacterium]|jgi:hypothetical protein
MGVIRTSFLISAVLVMLPSPPESRDSKPADKQVASATQFVGAALNSVADLDSFCVDHEGVCGTTGYLFERLELKARYNLALLYGWASADLIQTSPLANQANADPILTGSASKLSGRTGASRNTLRLDDLIPAWRGPQISRES